MVFIYLIFFLRTRLYANIDIKWGRCEACLFVTLAFIVAEIENQEVGEGGGRFKILQSCTGIQRSLDVTAPLCAGGVATFQIRAKAPARSRSRVHTEERKIGETSERHDTEVFDRTRRMCWFNIFLYSG